MLAFLLLLFDPYGLELLMGLIFSFFLLVCFEEVEVETEESVPPFAGLDVMTFFLDFFFFFCVVLFAEAGLVIFSKKESSGFLMTQSMMSFSLQ